MKLSCFTRKSHNKTAARPVGRVARPCPAQLFFVSVTGSSSLAQTAAIG